MVQLATISYKTLEKILDDYEAQNREVPLTARGYLSLIHEKITGKVKLKNFVYEDKDIYIL